MDNIGITMNSVNLVGRVMEPPKILDNGWAIMQVTTITREQDDSGQYVNVPVVSIVATNDPSKVKVIKDWIQPERQVVVLGTLKSNIQEDGQVMMYVKPSSISLGSKTIYRAD